MSIHALADRGQAEERSVIPEKYDLGRIAERDG